MAGAASGTAARRKARESTSIFEKPGENIGGFVVRCEIGRGGAGRVLEAVDPRLRRKVALKQLLPERRNDQLARRRFVEEAQIAGRLEHPGILPVYHLGIATDGSEFFCMKLASGRDLARLLESWHKGAREAEGWSLARFTAIFERVVEAVGYAHDRGVLHRDLKPSNVMIGDHGEVWLLDWGLAKSADRSEPSAKVDPKDDTAHRSPDLTGDGLAVGTPSYMAPEQARGEVADPASDVFGLGGILYHIITGKPPFAGKGVRSVLTASAEGRITPLRASVAGRRAPRALAAICMKCLAYERADRYADADALLADLRAFAAGDAVSALPEGPLARAARWVVRHRLIVGWAGGAIAALLVVVTVAAALVATKERQALDAQRAAAAAADRAHQAEMDRARAEAEEAERASRRVRAFAPYAAAMDLIARGQLPDRAVELLEKSLAIDQRFAEAQFALGEARRQRGDLVAAAEAYLEADRLTLAMGLGPHVPALLAAAFALDRCGEYERADAAFARLEDADPGHPLAQVGRAYRRIHRSEYADAVTTARAALAAAPHLWETHLALGESLIAATSSGVLPRRGPDAAAALGCLRRAHELAPHEAEACAVLGGALEGDEAARTEASELVDKAIELEPGNGGRWLQRARFRALSGDAEGARADREEARRRGASQALLLYHDAVLALSRGEREAACDLFAEHARRFGRWPVHVGNWMRLALSLGRLDDPDTRKRFERWCDDNPRSAQALLLRGKDRLRRGDDAAAAACAVAGVAVAPYDPDLQVLLAYVRYRARDLPGALAAADRALAEQPEHVEARRMRFSALASSGKLAEAERELERLERQVDPAEAVRLRAELAKLRAP